MGRLRVQSSTESILLTFCMEAQCKQTLKKFTCWWQSSASISGPWHSFPPKAGLTNYTWHKVCVLARQDTVPGPSARSSNTFNLAYITPYLGLLHLRVRWLTPPPHVREQGENSDQLDQEPCTTTEELSSPADTQRPFRHHCEEIITPV